MNLVKRAQEGHRMSLNMLLEDNYRMLYGFMLKLTGNEELAKDLTQDTMVKAVVSIRKFKGKSKFSSWLIRIGINNYKNHVRKHGRETVLLDERIMSSQQVEEKAIANDQIRRVNQYLGKVKPMDRMVFVLKHYEGYSYDEIAEMTGVKKGTCKSKVHYLTEKLRAELEGKP